MLTMVFLFEVEGRGRGWGGMVWVRLVSVGGIILLISYNNLCVRLNSELSCLHRYILSGVYQRVLYLRIILSVLLTLIVAKIILMMLTSYVGRCSFNRI